MCDQNVTERDRGSRCSEGRLGVKCEYVFVWVNYRAAEFGTIWSRFTDNCFGQVDKATLKSRQEETPAGIFVFVSQKDRNDFTLETFLIWWEHDWMIVLAFTLYTQVFFPIHLKQRGSICLNHRISKESHRKRMELLRRDCPQMIPQLVVVKVLIHFLLMKLCEDESDF